MCVAGWRYAHGNRGSHTAKSGQGPLTAGGTKSVLRVGGEPRETAGPTLRGAARSRTLLCQKCTRHSALEYIAPRLRGEWHCVQIATAVVEPPAKSLVEDTSCFVDSCRVHSATCKVGCPALRHGVQCACAKGVRLCRHSALVYNAPVPAVYTAECAALERLFVDYGEKSSKSRRPSWSRTTLSCAYAPCWNAVTLDYLFCGVKEFPRHSPSHTNFACTVQRVIRLGFYSSAIDHACGQLSSFQEPTGKVRSLWTLPFVAR